MHVLDGELRVRLVDETFDLTAGDLVRSSGDREIEPDGTTDATAIVTVAPDPGSDLGCWTARWPVREPVSR